MFTGIIDHCGSVTSVERRGDSLVLAVASAFDDVEEGESIAVDGVCLTAISPSANAFRCDVSPETLRLTRAADYRVGARLNLERSLRLSDRMGGHFVTGHADQKCRLTKSEARGEYRAYVFDGVLYKNRRFLVLKGSVAVNGVSLTVNAVTVSGFEVMLIPHTLGRTNLSELREGDSVNVEFDWMTKVLLSDLDKRVENLGRDGFLPLAGEIK